MKKIPLILATLVFSVPVHSHEVKHIKFNESELFLSQTEQLTEYSLPTTKIILQEEDTETRTAGYHPLAQLSLRGRLTRKVLDFPSHYSPYQINQLVEQQLTDHDYEMSFTCRGKQCGEVSGWHEFVTPHIAGDKDSQRIIIARKLFPNLDANYVLVHINDIDSEPRMVLDVIETSPSNNFKNNKQRPVSIGKFDTNSVKLDPANLVLLDNIAALIKSEPIRTFSLKGYSDSQGTESDNQTLSLQRAKSVLDYLVSQHSIAPDRFDVQGLGEARPIAKNDKGSGRQLNRRVEVSLSAEVKKQLAQGQDTSTLLK